jgi:hypothetical protein
MTQSITRELPRQNVTVVGAFNPAVLSPSWVKRFVPAVTDEISTLIPIEGGPPLFQAGPLYWVATSERLIVHGPISQAGAMVASIVRTLCHTPLRAAGINFQFQGRADREQCGPWRISSAREGVQGLLAGTPAELSLSQIGLREDAVRVTLKLLWISEEPDALLDINYHREGRAPLGEERAKEIADHAERGPEFEADAKRIQEELLRG